MFKFNQGSALNPAHADLAPRKKIVHENLSGIEQIVSPRLDYLNRELPKPRGYEYGQSYSQSAHPLSTPKKIPSPVNLDDDSSKKEAFLSVFEQLYESQEHTAQLQAQLKEQIRKSATLLYTLSSSGQMIEGLVSSHFREMQSSYNERLVTALTDLNKRLAVIEEKTLGQSQAKNVLKGGLSGNLGRSGIPNISPPVQHD
jgi:hypothetical protein